MPKPSIKEFEVALQGNLCRCTGYRPIIEGFKTFLEDYEILQAGNNLSNNEGRVCGMGDKCCKVKKDENVKCSKTEAILFRKSEFLPYDPTQEPIFPPELKLNSSLDKQSLQFTHQDYHWFRPVTLQQLLSLKSKHKTAKLITGNTEIGVETNMRGFVYPVYIQTNKIPELTSISSMENGVKVGASVTLSELENSLKEQIKSISEYKTRIFKQILEMLHWFASKQIRNVAAIGGNIMTSSPISDFNPIFLAARVELEVASKARGIRRIVMDENFFTGYRRNVVAEDEVLVSILCKYVSNMYFNVFKYIENIFNLIYFKKA